MDDEKPGNLPEYSVSELSGAVKRTMEEAFSYVRVRGELGRISRPASGHLYLDLKDDRAVLAGVMWKGTASRLSIDLEQGLEVIASGRMTTFPGQSKYQLVIEQIEPAGIGALLAQLEERRKRLAAEGLFDSDAKSPLPVMPQVIGVVTSPTGAVIRDILHRLRERFPVHVLVWPCRVQGEGAASEIAAGIVGFNKIKPGGPVPRPDVLIVARGGGSVEDLWAFNEEIVVRTAAESAIPLISAVGHETDTTLIDYASDLRAPTPTAAAEIAVPVRDDWLATLEERKASLLRALRQLTRHSRSRLDLAQRGLPRLDDLVGTARQRFDNTRVRLRPAMLRTLRDRSNALAVLSANLPRLKELASRSQEQVRRLETELDRALRQQLRTERQRQQVLAARLRPELISAANTRRQERLATMQARLSRSLSAIVERSRNAMDRNGRLLATLGHRATLARGFVLVRDDEGALVRGKERAAGLAMLDLEFADGRLLVSPDSGGDKGKPASQGTLAQPKKQPKPSQKPAPKPRKTDDQGSLF